MGERTAPFRDQNEYARQGRTQTCQDRSCRQQAVPSGPWNTHPQQAGNECANRSTGGRASPWETLKKAASGMKRKALGAQRPRHNNELGEGASTAQRSDSPAQQFIQRFPWPRRSSVAVNLSAVWLMTLS